ncbi:MAG: flagellar hook basal-body protein [Candidatus Saccharimonas sp.]|nr:flagellar hook basal-body protein [Planctomycetaceae bacterium]
MGWRRHSGAVVSLALLASVVGHYALHRQFEARFQSLVATSRFDGHLKPGPPLMPPDDDGPSAIPRFLDEHDRPHRLGQILPALQIRDEEDPDRAPSKSSRPQPVPVPHEATPLADADKPADAAPEKQPPVLIDDNAVRRVIEEELLGSSREERDIWFDELKSLPAGVVRDLLQVRKQLRSLPRALHKADAAVTPPARAAVRIAEVFAEPASQSRRQPFPDWTPTLAALEQATSLSRHNVANSVTPGYKRIRWHLVDAYGPRSDDEVDAEAAPGDATRSSKLTPVQVEGCRLAVPLLDLKQGTQVETARPLDLAIDGDGFFVATWNEKQVFTRCGAIGLDAKRRLCLTLVEGSAVVQPPVAIPEDAQEIQITAKGEVLVLRVAGTDPQSVGCLQLAQFASPERLRPIGATLLVATDASGAAVLGEPEAGGRGAIQQGCLEQSNVDVEMELADIERLQSLLKSLPMQARPVTASGTAPASR